MPCMMEHLNAGFYASMGVVTVLITGFHYGYIASQYDVLRFSLLAVIFIIIGSDLPRHRREESPDQQDVPNPGSGDGRAGFVGTRLVATDRFSAVRLVNRSLYEHANNGCHYAGAIVGAIKFSSLILATTALCSSPGSSGLKTGLEPLTPSVVPSLWKRAGTTAK